MRVFRYLVFCLMIPTAGVAQLRGIPTENIDRSVNPCTDFDAYANGQWRATHPMPDIQLRGLSAPSPRTTHGPACARSLRRTRESRSLAKGSPGRLTGDFYAACMDEARIDSLGLQPIEPLWKQVDAVSNAQQLGRPDRAAAANRSGGTARNICHARPSQPHADDR